MHTIHIWTIWFTNCLFCVKILYYMHYMYYKADIVSVLISSYSIFVFYNPLKYWTFFMMSSVINLTNYWKKTIHDQSVNNVQKSTNSTNRTFVLAAIEIELVNVKEKLYTIQYFTNLNSYISVRFERFSPFS